jgi:hypothetical protein
MSHSRATAPSASREAKPAAVMRAVVPLRASSSFRASEEAGTGLRIDFSRIPIVAGRPLLQRKLTVGAADDCCEREADAMAAEVMRAPLAAPVTRRAGAVQRKCGACAQEEENKKVRRRSADSSHGGGALAPPIVHQVLRTPGDPLASSTRAFFEPRFGHDFSRVRVHADAQAARSAQSVGAQAYTVGNHIVFNTGRYAPATAGGDELLAHELTHTVQQGATPASTLRRSAGGFFANMGRAFVGIFTDEPDYSDDDLNAYLGVLDTTGDIEDDYDSDNKARAVVNKWKKGGSPFSLTEQRKALLIREMLSGVVGDDDEIAILEVLERSFNFELTYMFGAGGVTVATLDSKLDGEEHDRLKDFFERRFQNGFDGAMHGDLTPRQTGLPNDVGEPLGQFNLMAESHTQWDVACVLGILCSEDQSVVAELPKLTVQTADQVVEVYWEYDGAKWQKKERNRGAFSKADEKIIGLKSDMTCARAAEAIVHEVRHQGQAASMDPIAKELDAYTFAEEWSIKRGLPGFSPAFHTSVKDAKAGTEKIVPDAAAIDAYVKKRYSGGAGTPGDQVIGHLATGEAKIEHPDGTTDNRPANVGDSHQDVAATKANLSNLPKVDPKLWVCPQTGPQKSP